jgi:hypothetical protein
MIARRPAAAAIALRACSPWFPREVFESSCYHLCLLGQRLSQLGEDGVPGVFFMEGMQFRR